MHQVTKWHFPFHTPLHHVSSVLRYGAFTLYVTLPKHVVLIAWGTVLET